MTSVGPTSRSISLWPNGRPGWNRMSKFILSSSSSSKRPIPGFFGISCIYLLVLFGNVFLQWISSNKEQETGMYLHHEIAVQLSCESVVVGGTVLHTHAYVCEGEGSPLHGQSWLAVLENAWTWSVLIGERMKGAVCNLISKKPYSCNIIGEKIYYCCIILTIIFLLNKLLIYFLV